MDSKGHVINMAAN